MALHNELAELRAAVGPQVFDDPVAFRAAFDDYVPEGSATTGEVSLLVGAIATGALQRLREQLALGAEPEMTIAAQGDLLARDRGTSESSGARWALSVLAHATGAVPAESVLTRPTPGPDGLGTAGRPPAATTPDGLDVGPTRPVADPPAMLPPTPPDAATRVVADDGPSDGAPATPRPGRGLSPLLVAAAVVLAAVAVTVLVVLLVSGNDESPDDRAEDGGGTAGSSGADEELLAEIEVEDAGETVRIRLVADGADASVVLLADQDGDYVEVDREAVTCPFLDSSYDPVLEDEGDQQLTWGWQNEGAEGFGEYGEVLVEEGRLIKYASDGLACPTAG